jgi:hypothetical protein
MRNLFIACALLAACGDGSSHESEVGQYLGVWQVTGGGGSWQCADGTRGDKSVTVGDRFSIGPNSGHDLLVTSPKGCTAAFDISGNQATGNLLICPEQSYPMSSTLVVANDVLTWIGTTPFGTNCSETDTTIFARVAAN